MRVAFLEFASPSISDVVNRCFTQGVKEIVVLPYFLSAGNHVVKDIPHEINKVMNIWPDRRITTLPYIGAMRA
ncbi:MAG: CbiX/SirB N-terminal domain-containing protein [Oleispira sp.]|nr:CbiX/SirB N-terminal domain-containing protein [Oleispira sp.]